MLMSRWLTASEAETLEAHSLDFLLVPEKPLNSMSKLLLSQPLVIQNTHLSWVSLVVVSFSVKSSFSSPSEKCLSTSCSSSTTQLLRAFLWVWRWNIFSSMVPVYRQVRDEAQLEHWC